MNIKKIYIVTANAGMYEDNQSWNVAVYLDEEKAYEHAEKARSLLVDASTWSRDKIQNFKSSYDPHISFGHGFIPEYEVEEIDVFYEVPQHMSHGPTEDDSYMSQICSVGKLQHLCKS